ncbi:histone-lysine N-methyltransferase SETMAR [Plakobranchus ocellatus]|uniref:Histone-lysine N-methyltransferase SETMAR n=1 Tax=Plakobranchus ocellatus TaxID=259542 RepID=A0AAV4DNF2_9GAST|nr:histone-lysine N-methyltransferase SETMAR [Plakobranchus ocellatus]
MSEKKQEKGHNSKSFDQINLKLTQIEVHSSTTLRRSRVLQYRAAKGVILLDILPQGQCINAARYCSTLDRLKEAIRRKRPGLLRRGVVHQHDNATPHSANLTQQWLQRYSWEILLHPAHSPDLAPSDFHLFGTLKPHLGGMAFETEDDLIINLKAFPALQALAGSWSNDKLAPAHLEFVTLGKFVVKHARVTWYQLSSQPYTEPDLRRYALLKLTILTALTAMNRIYKLYMDKISADVSSKSRRKLSWLPRFSRQQMKD